MSETLRPFHLAIPVSDLEASRQFYVNVLGCSIGRYAERWIDFDFFGHQLSVHHKPAALKDVMTNDVDGEQVPVQHFGIVLEWQHWHTLRDELQDRKVNFIIEPTTRFAGGRGEQATLFIKDPSGNALEFKSFKDESLLFAT